MADFKTPKELGLTEAQFCALVKTLHALDNDLLHEYNITGFDMGFWGGRCGTACCLGGSAEIIGGFPRYELSRQTQTNGPLHRLFYPASASGAYGATNKQGAAALRSYLTTGKSRWSAAMRGEIK